jgi:hypothetical protein
MEITRNSAEITRNSKGIHKEFKRNSKGIHKEFKRNSQGNQRESRGSTRNHEEIMRNSRGIPRNSSKILGIPPKSAEFLDMEEFLQIPRNSFWNPYTLKSLRPQNFSFYFK